MSYWGKVVGGAAGFVVGGPFGAVLGAALGHAADRGALSLSNLTAPKNLLGNTVHPARLAAMFAPREQVFALSVISLSAKLAKIDGSVNRAEIDAFKRHFRIPPAQVRDVGRLFDTARRDATDYEGYARQLGDTFRDSRGVLEDVLAALFAIARSDGPVNPREQDFLGRCARAFHLDQTAWERARGGQARPNHGASAPDAYQVLGVSPSASSEEVRAAWKALVRDNHPDSLAARGVTPEFIANAHEKVARINAAWDVVKRERGL